MLLDDPVDGLWSDQAISTFVSRAFGEKNHDELNKAIAVSVQLTALISFVLTVAGVSLADWMLRLLKTPEDILPGAKAYLTVMVVGTMIVAAYNMASSILRALGDGKSPLIAM